MMITEFLNGHTVEDVRRNRDGSVTLYCDSGRTMTLHVLDGCIQVRPEKIVLPDAPPEEPIFSERMRLLEAFAGHQVNYVTMDEHGCVTFVCEPQRGREMYSKSYGHREVRLTHSDGLIDELPPVSAVIRLPSLAVFGVQT